MGFGQNQRLHHRRGRFDRLNDRHRFRQPQAVHHPLPEMRGRGIWHGSGQQRLPADGFGRQQPEGGRRHHHRRVVQRDAPGIRHGGGRSHRTHLYGPHGEVLFARRGLHGCRGGRGCQLVGDMRPPRVVEGLRQVHILCIARRVGGGRFSTYEQVPDGYGERKDLHHPQRH